MAAAEAGVKGVVATQGGCPPLFGPAAPGSGADIWPACEKFAADAATYFEKTESLKTVVIAVNWLRYEPSFVSRTLSRIARVQAARGGQVVVILPVPNPGEDVPKQWIRRQLIAGKKISEWSIARDREAGVLQRSKELAAIAMNEANIILVDPFENLCDQDRCFTVKADRALYMDVEHLSTAGASLLQPAISKAIKRALVEGGASLPPMGEGD